MTLFRLLAVLLLSCSPVHQAGAQWIQRAPMPTARQEVPHAVLEGKIFIAGGLLQNGATNLVEVYDPARNTWSTVAGLPQAIHHSAIAQADNRLFVIGGYSGFSFSETNVVFEYDAGANRWRDRAFPSIRRGAGAAVALDGKVYFIGGTVFGVASTLNQAYDPGDDAWETLAPMRHAREHLAAAVVDSLIYVVGGRARNQFGQLVNSRKIEVYSPARNVWTELRDMPTARGGLAAAAHNGLLYTFGGEIPGVFDETEIYDPVTDRWQPGPPMLTARHGMGAVTVGDTIYVIGGGLIANIRPTAANEALVLANPTSVDDGPPVPAGFSLAQNHPNPFNPATTIRFSLAEAATVTLKIFNLLGQEIATLVDGRLAAGEHQVNWDARNQATGLYLYRLALADGRVLTRKMLLAR